MLSNFKKNKEKNVQREERQFIVFSVGEEKFGVDVKQAREIMPITEFTHIPDAPDYVNGVINLRGEIIPIIDLCKKMSLAGGKIETKDAKIIVVELDDTLIGMQVDSVSEMIRLYVDDIAAPPKIVKGGINRDYLSGVGKLDDQLLILLDLNKILSKEEREQLDEIEV